MSKGGRTWTSQLKHRANLVFRHSFVSQTID